VAKNGITFGCDLRKDAFFCKGLHYLIATGSLSTSLTVPIDVKNILLSNGRKILRKGKNLIDGDG
jgi:hypothetical protein